MAPSPSAPPTKNAGEPSDFLAIENVVDPETNLKSQKQMICNFGLVISHYSFFTPKMSCDFDVSKFPFDKQSCHITIQQKPERLWKTFFGIQLEGYNYSFLNKVDRLLTRKAFLDLQSTFKILCSSQ